MPQCRHHIDIDWAVRPSSACWRQNPEVATEESAEENRETKHERALRCVRCLGQDERTEGQKAVV